jgi:hypothetical protein
MPTHLPARTRGRRWLRLTPKDHLRRAKLNRRSATRKINYRNLVCLLMRELANPLLRSCLDDAHQVALRVL